MLLLHSSPRQFNPSHHQQHHHLSRNAVAQASTRSFFSCRKFLEFRCRSFSVKDRSQNGAHIASKHDDFVERSNICTTRRFILTLLVLQGFYPSPSQGKTKAKNPYDERRLLEQNKQIQKANNAPIDFPNFIREGFEVKVVAPEGYIKSESGLIYQDIEVGKGDCPKAGQQVTFHYTGYNESGRRIDSSYMQGSPARIRMGTNALVPGFEEGIRDMRPGGRRRIIIPPELGPPVGPSTFFSSKQFEVFDIELLSVEDCKRRTIGFYSDLVCG
ncbi:hypothetical protein Droror1_Dr00011344 [Drosera rotundifolia]